MKFFVADKCPGRKSEQLLSVDGRESGGSGKQGPGCGWWGK